MLRGDDARTAGLASATRHLLRRAGVLALACAVLTIAFRTISWATGYWPDVPNADAPGSLLEYALGAVVLRRTYGDHNLLAAYALFLAAAWSPASTTPGWPGGGTSYRRAPVGSSSPSPRRPRSRSSPAR
jgi:hypothetical protein